MPKNNSYINKNINNNTNKNNGKESIVHDRISKQSKKKIANHNNTNSNKTSKVRNNTNNTGAMRIDHIEVTDEVLTDRSGILLFARYLAKIGIYPLIEKYFSSMRKSKKGIPIRTCSNSYSVTSLMVRLYA